MKKHKMKAFDLVKLLEVSEGLISDMLNYSKGLSKDTIRILSKKFKLNQEAFNGPYELNLPIASQSIQSRIVKGGKKLASA
jgi:HTH-type transcriptional regulator / antitoxin HigA